MKKNILLVEPEINTKYPPLGLIKLATLFKSGDVRLVRGCVLKDVVLQDFEPTHIFITSLFTWEAKPVIDAIMYYHAMYPSAYITVGGIYATLFAKELTEMFRHLHGRFHIVAGVLPAATDSLIPDYDILQQVPRWKDWDRSILFTTRGCVRNCPWCIVPKVEGRKLRAVIENISPYIHPDHHGVVLWDNNLLASPTAASILRQLKDIGLSISFNQGLDARLMTDEFAGLLADLKLPVLHMAYDTTSEGPAVEHAVQCLRDAGYAGRKIVIYNLFNFYDRRFPDMADTPASFLKIVQHTLNLGAASYPMRYQPLDTREKNSFISPNWTKRELRMVEETRANFGGNGTIYASGKAVEILNSARSFEDMFDYFGVA